MNTTCMIYGLVDPITNVLRYVGKTRTSITARLRAHFRDRCHCHRTMWLKSLRLAGLMPRVVILDQVPLADGSDAEIQMIAFIRSTGAELLNGTDGGDGLSNVTPAVRRKMSESRLRQPTNPMAIQAMRAANLGTPKSEATRAKTAAARRRHLAVKENRDRIGRSLLGHAVSAETREKISASLRGRKRPEDVRRKISEGNRGRVLSEESRRKSSESNKRTWERKRLERAGKLLPSGE